MIHEINCKEACANKMKLYPETSQVIFMTQICYSLGSHWIGAITAAFIE